MSGRIRVLVVDDSAFMRKMVTDLLNASGGIEVVGQARDGRDGVAKAIELKPDVVTLDVEMPEMDGITALGEILKHTSSKVVMLSSLTQDGAATTLKCLEKGAIDFIGKPSGSISLDIAKISDELLYKVFAAAKARPRLFNASIVARPAAAVRLATPPLSKSSLVVIGSSTGGPRAIQEVIPHLPADLGTPVVVVQHIPQNFSATLARRLDDMSPLRVKEAEQDERLTPGVVLLAPGGYHLEFDISGRVKITDGPTVHGVRPSVDVTIASLVKTYSRKMTGVLLTGMGKDGAAGLKQIHDAGGRTIVEDESTCVVFGMPKAAIDLGAAQRVLPLHDIAQAICESVGMAKTADALSA